MKDVNKVILLGRLGTDPVLKETKNGLAVTSFSVATSRRAADESSERQTQWHKVVAWGKQAEACVGHLKKGECVYIEGTMKSRKYDGKDGNSKMAFEVHVDDISFLGNRAKKAEISTEPEAVAS